MRRLLRLSCLIALIFVLFSACAEATDWLNQYEEEEIGVLYLDAEYLKSFAGKYEGRAVCTKLYFDKTGDEDGQILTIGRENGEFDIKVNFEDASEYRYLESNDSFVVVGIVGTKDAVLVNSHIVPSEQVEGIQFFNSEQYVMRLRDKNDDVYQLQEKGN